MMLTKNKIMKNTILIFCFLSLLFSCKEEAKDHRKPISPAAANNSNLEKDTASIKIHPIEHASLILEVQEKSIYVDPVGEISAYQDFSKPDIVLLTDIHPDHLNQNTLEALVEKNTQIIAPKAVLQKLTAALKKRTKLLNNSEETKLGSIAIKVIPMYNLPESAESMHPKGRGNGYVLQTGKKNIYIAGDTEDIPEMRSLQDIDIAFIPMNLPYTMEVEDAADAVLDFQPKTVYPYHYRGKDEFSDVEKFKNIVTTNNPKIKVVLLDWYPNKQSK